MTGPNVRPARASERNAIAGVHRAAFGRDDEAALALALIEEGDAALSLVAEIGNAIVGHVLYSRLDGPPGALALAPVGILPEHQNKGFGTALVRQSLEAARRDGWRSVFVLGEPAYYGRFGFSADLAAGAQTPWSGPYFQGLELQPESLRDFRGPLRYAPAFTLL